MYEQDLSLNNLQGLICHKPQQKELYISSSSSCRAGAINPNEKNLYILL